jgi:hypothetical protein
MVYGHSAGGRQKLNMVARGVSFRLKPNSAAEFHEVLREEIHPALQIMKGFRGHIVYVLRDGDAAVDFSFWDVNESESAQVSFKVMLALTKLVQGNLQNDVCDLFDTKSDHGRALQSVVAMVEESTCFQIFEVSGPVFCRLIGDKLLTL